MVEAILITLIGTAALSWLVVRQRQARLAVFLIALSAVGVGAVASVLRRPHVDPALQAELPRPDFENGYATSSTCRACHPREYETWHSTYHRTMTQRATPETVIGDFNGVTLQSWDRTYRLERRGDEFWVEMVDPDWDFDRENGPAAAKSAVDASAAPRVWTRVVMTTGSHHMQTYWVPSQKDRGLRSLPFLWLKEDQRWIPREDGFIRSHEAGRMVPEWNSNCLKCHSTAPNPAYDLKTGLQNTSTVELGIACEACHGPAEHHVAANQDPHRRYTYRLGGLASDPTIVHPGKLSADASAHVCGQCHGISRVLDNAHFATHGFRYRPGDDLYKTRTYLRHPKSRITEGANAADSSDAELMRKYFWPDGVVRVSGREFTAMSESACYTKGDLSCLSCHSMHDSDANDQLAARMETNEACLQCHESYRKDIPAHTHHAAGSAGSECYNCHMPFTAYGLLKGIRNHYIDSPMAGALAEHARPNACNLCHLDQTLAWTAEYLNQWYGQKTTREFSTDERAISAALLWMLRGDAGQRALVAYQMAWDAAQQASDSQWFTPFLARLLDDPYSAVRYIAARTLRTMPGFTDLRFDFIGPAAERQAAAEEVLRRWTTEQAGSSGANARLLIDANGALNQAAVDRLWRERDDSLSFLSE